MAKKLAMGVNKLLIDIPTGYGAKVKTTKEEYISNVRNKVIYGNFIGSVIGNKFENPELLMEGDAKC